jgi:hypothetical protein
MFSFFLVAQTRNDASELDQYDSCAPQFASGLFKVHICCSIIDANYFCMVNCFMISLRALLIFGRILGKISYKFNVICGKLNALCTLVR